MKAYNACLSESTLQQCKNTLVLFFFGGKILNVVLGHITISVHIAGFFPSSHPKLLITFFK